MTQLVRVHNFAVSRDGYAAGEGQSLERPFGHADPWALMSWAGATASWPNRTDTLHVAVAPLDLGGGSRLWDAPDELLDRYHRDVVPGSNGVTHHLFWRE